MGTVKDAVKIWLAGVILEDQEWPKKCGHFEGKRVLPMNKPLANYLLL
jgi:methylisocitrate lyase